MIVFVSDSSLDKTDKVPIVDFILKEPGGIFS
jgi:hypothetical protein